jgi:hypothetical protein
VGLSKNNTSIIIAAAGKGSRWSNNISELKQLAVIDGKPVIQRTIDLLHKYGYMNIYVATKSNILARAIYNAQIIIPDKTNSLSDTILSCSEYFSDKTKILLGDVYYSEQALRAILKKENSYQFFGLDRSSSPVMEENRTPEIFAFSFRRKDTAHVIELLNENSKYATIRDHKSRFQRVWLWIREGKAKRNLKMAYGPIPPEYLKKRGFRNFLLWKVVRICIYKPNYEWIYGKLWGLYTLAADIDPYSGKNATWPETSNKYFTQINDITDDIDDEADFLRLQEKLQSNKC